MRKLILQMQMSIDGFVAAKDSRLKWQVWDWGPKFPWDDALKTKFNAIFASVDTVLLSRNMVKGGFIDHWTEAADTFADNPDYAFAKRILAAEKVVVTRKSMKSKWNHTLIVHRSLSKEVKALKKERGQDIIAFGGVRFAAALSETGLVDEFQFFINPSIIGNGASIFKGKRGLLRMKLKQSTSFGCGIVVNQYIPSTKRG